MARTADRSAEPATCPVQRAVGALRRILSPRRNHALSGASARGRQIVAGNFLFAGHLVEAPGLDIWDIPAPDVTFTAELHGFGWLDDLAALGDFAAFERARGWTFEWIERFGRGKRAGLDAGPDRATRFALDKQLGGAAERAG